jgi:hypothetical protein
MDGSPTEMRACNCERRRLFLATCVWDLGITDFCEHKPQHDTSAATPASHSASKRSRGGASFEIRILLSWLAFKLHKISRHPPPPCWQLTSPLAHSAQTRKTKDQDEVPTSSHFGQQQPWRRLLQQLSWCCSLVRQGHQQPHEREQRHVLGPAPGGSAGCAASLAAARAARAGAAAQASRRRRDAPPRWTLGRSARVVRVVTRQVASLHNLEPPLTRRPPSPETTGSREEEEKVGSSLVTMTERRQSRRGSPLLSTKDPANVLVVSHRARGEIGTPCARTIDVTRLPEP